MRCGTHVVHTPRGPGGPLLDKAFSGGSQVFDEPAFTVRGTNVSQDKETGIGAWSDSQIKRAITEGVRPDGRQLAPVMPHAFYKVLSPRDLDAIVAYLRSVPAVRNEVATPVYKAPLPVAVIPGADKPMPGEGLKDPMQRGFYLANLAHCMACHARRPDGTHDLVGGLGRGGHLMKGPWGAAVVSNITSHPTSGIGAWKDSEIKRALTEGVSRDGRELKTPMARAAYFSRMTAEDLNAIVAYLRTLPPLE